MFRNGTAVASGGGGAHTTEGIVKYLLAEKAKEVSTQGIRAALALEFVVGVYPVCGLFLGRTPRALGVDGVITSRYHHP